MDLNNRAVIAQNDFYDVFYVPPQEREVIQNKDGDVVTNYEVVNRQFNVIELQTDCLPIAMAMFHTWGAALDKVREDFENIEELEANWPATETLQ